MRASEKERYTNTRENEKKRREENRERYICIMRKVCRKYAERSA